MVPVFGRTALHGLRDAGRLEAGQHVMIIGASGGVGSFAVQLAKAFGAEVTGVCSTAKVDFVRSLGADHVTDYARQDFAVGSSRYDLIFDMGWNTPLARLRRALAPPLGRTTPTSKSSRSSTAGAVTPSIDRIYTLDQAPQALHQLEAGQVRGKLAIAIGSHK